MSIIYGIIVLDRIFNKGAYMQPDLREVEAAFFAAMRAGWAQKGIQKIKVPEFPGSKAIPFLKQCLRRAYVDEQRFYGGRGPSFVRDERFTYVNRIERNDFGDFMGEERIFDLSEQCFGYHWYRGMSLLKNNQ